MSAAKLVKNNLAYAVLFLIIIIGGIFAAILTAKTTDSELRENILHQAKLIAPAININRIKTLTGTETDIISADYKRLKEQLFLIKSADDHFKFTYFLGINSEGNIFFFLDNEDPESKDYSPPGQLYEDATDELKAVFFSKSAIVEGPESDEWGTWVSTIVPLIDPDTGKVIAVMGIDIDAKDWKWSVLSKSILSIGTVILFILLLAMLLNGVRIAAKLKENENDIRKANENLSMMVERLEVQNLRAKMVSELREYLSACQTAVETGPVIQKYLKKFFPGSDGALFLLSASKTDLESIAKWGNYSDCIEENCLSPDECWGLRRGTNYIIANSETDVPCSHIKKPETGVLYACFPLIAKNETIGLLHIRCFHHSNFDDEKKQYFKETAETLTALLSLAISNIKLTEKLNMLSIKDPLTGLFNRRYLEETFFREATRAKRNKTNIGIIMADIDHFKKFNDLFGHAAGDHVLAELAKFLTANLRGCDIICRYGGEEFALIMPDANLENTFIRAQNLIEQIRTLRLSFNGQALGNITLSMGVSTYPAQGKKLEELLKIADLALYRAKKEGRDRVIAADVTNQ